MSNWSTSIGIVVVAVVGVDDRVAVDFVLDKLNRDYLILHMEHVQQQLNHDDEDHYDSLQVNYNFLFDDIVEKQVDSVVVEDEYELYQER